jgi:predicted nucleic acid-binding protein
MAILFFDSSAIVKRYIAEVGSDWIAGLMAPTARNAVYIGVVSGAEVVAAFVRRRRGGSLTPDQESHAIAEFEDDWSNLYDLVRADRAVVSRAMLLAQRHGLRGYDAVQLASALEVNALAQQFQDPFLFVSADDELNAAATAEGLQVENPNLHP